MVFIVFLPYEWRDLNVSVLWLLIVADGKGEIVVNTTDLCTLNLFAMLAIKGDTHADMR